MKTTFNPNELLLDRVRGVRECDVNTKELISRWTQIEDASLKTSADASEVADAMGATIHTFYRAQKGTFDFTNSLFSLDLAASQFGADKIVASEDNKIIVPVSEIINIGSDHTVVLQHVPVGTTGAEIKYVKVINDDNTFGETYEVSPTAGVGKFTINAETKTITLPDDATGKVIVDYNKESDTAVQITKTTDNISKVRTLYIDVVFRDKCNPNLKYAGVIICPRAQSDPTNVELSLKSDGKHSASYNLNKEYCNEDGKLFDIVVYK